MGIIPDLSLAKEDQPFEQAWRPSRSWRGFAVEHVSLHDTEAYKFRWQGDSHYVALHDLLLEDGGSVVDDLKPDSTRDLRNTITFLPSGCSIEGWSKPVERRNSFTALYFRPSLLREDLDLRYRETTLQPILYAREGRLQESMRKLSAMIADPHVDDVYAESACILAAIEALGIKPPESAGALTGRQMKLVIHYIAEHLADEISLSDLASAANLSRYHFARAFKAGTGQSPYLFVMARRVERASELLTTTDLAIEAVALLAGFKTTARLRRYFQQIKGVTPRAFRRNLG